MIKKPLETLFQAMYHGKYDYKDFIGGDVALRYRAEVIKDPQKNKERLVYAPDKTLKLYHGFLNLFLFDYLEINERVVFSYRKGVNVASAVALHAQSKHFYQADIQNFFPSVGSELVRKVILESAARCPISDLENNLDRVIEMVTVEDALPVGFPTSPIISNAVLLQFDNIFEGYCNENNLIYTRYSDDIIVSSHTKESIFSLSEKIESIFRMAGLDQLSLHADKVKITSVGRKIKLLGMVILPNGTISIDIKLKNYIETLLHLYVKDKSEFRDFIATDITKGMERLSGYLNYVNTVDKQYLDKLRRKYGVTVIDMLIHQSKK